MAVDTAVLVLGASILVLALGARVATHLFLSPVLLAMLAGILLGPSVAGVVMLGDLGDSMVVLREVARIALAISVVGVGLQVTADDLRRAMRAVVRLLSAGMIGMWLVTSAGALLILDLPVWAAFLLGAVLTPTDPAVASSMVSAPLAIKNLPRRLRRTVQLESGANDGLAVPFVLLAGMMLDDPGVGTLGGWLADAAREVGVAVAMGLGLGLALGVVARIEYDRRQAEPSHLVDAGIGLGLLMLGGTHLLGGSGILAAFVAGVAFSIRLNAEERDTIERAQASVLNMLLVPVFVLFGASLPWAAWGELGVAGGLFVAWVLLLRRPVAVVAALGRGRHELDARGVAWLAWFGPLGMAGIYYATLSARTFAGGASIFPAASLAIFASVVVHAVTATPGARWYAGHDPLRTLRHPLDPDAE